MFLVLRTKKKAKKKSCLIASRSKKRIFLETDVVFGKEKRYWKVFLTSWTQFPLLWRQKNREKSIGDVVNIGFAQTKK